MKTAKRCVFFDRDGIVNAKPDPERYVTAWEKFHLNPEFLDVLRLVGEKGYASVVVTNQSGIGRGALKEATVTEIHDNLLKVLRADALDLLDIIVCPSADDGHPDRKPNPGMLLEAARKHHLDLSQSWMIGDQERDVLAGKRAGCRTILVDDTTKPSVADHRVASMADLVELLGTCL